MDYQKAYEELDKILTASGNTVFINGQPLATATAGEALRPHIKEQAAYEMEDYGLSAQEAAQKIAAKLRAADENDLTWWRQNGWLKSVIG